MFTRDLFDELDLRVDVLFDFDLFLLSFLVFSSWWCSWCVIFICPLIDLPLLSLVFRLAPLLYFFNLFFLISLSLSLLLCSSVPIAALTELLLGVGSRFRGILSELFLFMVLPLLSSLSLEVVFLVLSRFGACVVRVVVVFNFFRK